MKMSKNENEKKYMRMPLAHRIQHGALIFSFALLILSGMPVRYYDAPLSGFLLKLMGGMQMRGVIHRAGAVLLIGLCIFHLGGLLFLSRAREEMKEFFPRLKDLTDAFHHVFYNLGRRDDPPRYGKYNFIEKFEYLAVAWGSVVMILTGFVLWHENFFLSLIPKRLWDAARVAHSYEAVLAFLAIIIWHFYNVHLNPEVFPMSRVWLDGKITEEELKKHHHLQYEKMIEKSVQDGNLQSKELEGGDENF